jgi:hypothetical protein
MSFAVILPVTVNHIMHVTDVTASITVHLSQGNFTSDTKLNSVLQRTEYSIVTAKIVPMKLNSLYVLIFSLALAVLAGSSNAEKFSWANKLRYSKLIYWKQMTIPIAQIKSFMYPYETEICLNLYWNQNLESFTWATK